MTQQHRSQKTGRFALWGLIILGLPLLLFPFYLLDRLRGVSLVFLTTLIMTVELD